VRLLLLLAGVVLVLASSRTQAGTQPSLALFSLGTATITTAFFTIVSSAFGADLPSMIEDRIGFQGATYDLGLERIYTRLGDESIFERFSDAKSIDLMYTTGRTCTHRHGALVVKAIRNKGCTVRILVAHPDNAIFSDTQLITGLCPGTDLHRELKDAITEIELMVEELQKSPRPTRGSLELRGYFCPPMNSIAIVDDELVRHTPYLAYDHSSAVPIYEITRVRGGELFGQYRNTFDRVWTRSVTLITEDFGNQGGGEPGEVENRETPS
jgi:hypothetical protein